MKGDMSERERNHITGERSEEKERRREREREREKERHGVSEEEKEIGSATRTEIGSKP